MTDPMAPPSVRCRFLGAEVDALDSTELDGAVADAIALGRRIVVANHNLHSLYLLRSEPALGEFFSRAEVIHIDGMPLVWVGRSLGFPLERRHRTTYVDWFPHLMALAAARGWRVFYCGSKPGVAAAGIETLRRRHPGLQAWACHGYLDTGSSSLSSEDVIGQIAELRPHLLFVGMGMPRQELWISRHLQQLQANVILPCGAAIDYVAGAIPTPPRWVGQVGLEWLARLISEPRRLGRRYLVEPWSLALPFLRELAARRLGIKSSRS